MRIWSRVKGWFLGSDIPKCMPTHNCEMLEESKDPVELKIEEIERQRATKVHSYTSGQKKKRRHGGVHYATHIGFSGIKPILLKEKADLMEKAKDGQFFFRTNKFGCFLKQKRKGKNPGKKGWYVKAFLRNRCEYEKTGIASLNDLYKEYLEWCEATSVPQERMCTRQGIARFLNPRLVRPILLEAGKDRGIRKLLYQGIKIRSKEQT